MTAIDPSDRQAFEALVRRHQAQVCAIAYAVLRDRARSDEVAQDAFLIAWRDRAAVTPSARWICGIARNLARNVARRRREAPMTDDPATPARDARDELITREDVARAEAAIARLPERYREAVVLYYVGEQSIVEVASALGISEDSARQRVHRGRERLRERLATVEATLRATRPTAAFTAACVAAWTIGTPTPARAMAMPRRLVVPTLGAGALALALSVTAAVAVGVVHARRGPTRSTTASDPRAALHRRFPPSPRPVLGSALPRGVFALGPSSMMPVATGAVPAPAPKLVDLDFRMAPFDHLMQLFRGELDTPIWVAYETDAKIDIATHGRRPAIEVLDQVLDQASASRTEVAAIRIVPGGRTDAATLGGEPVSLSFHATPLNFVLDALEPKLGMPIGRLGHEVLPGQTDEDGKPAVEQSPPVTLELRDVPAGAALEQALIQTGVGYELTTGFVILPK